MLNNPQFYTMQYYATKHLCDKESTIGKSEKNGQKMSLLNGFGLLHGPTLCSNESIIAFVGGGGKTTLSLALSREISESLRSCVLISTTTKMFQARISEDCDVVVMGT